VLIDAGHEARAVEGAKSQYDVVVNGSVAFSKQREGRFPEEDEILELVAVRTGASPG
jgi:Rdx family